MHVGDIFESKNDGEFKILENERWDRVVIKFNSGYIGLITRNQIKLGKVKDYFKPTYFGVGFVGRRGLTKKDRKSTTIFNRWKNMLSRCYNPSDVSYKNYGGNGVYVCKDWHNLSNYINWINNFNIKGMDVDKDILSYGEKYYSPETCKVVYHKENCDFSMSKMYTFNNPLGELVVISNLLDFCKENNLTPANMHKVLNGDRGHHKGYTNGKRLT